MRVRTSVTPVRCSGFGIIAMAQLSVVNVLTFIRAAMHRFQWEAFLIDPILFIFDEPTTGLHFHDINRLMDALNALVENGHTVLIVEHNLDVIKTADWIIDLGPVGGKDGGYLMYQGPPEGIVKIKESYTGQFLKEKLS